MDNSVNHAGRFQPATNVFFAPSGRHRYFNAAVAAATRFATVRTLALDENETHPLYGEFLKFYRHHSGKSEEYELWCFKRYFLLLDALAASGVSHAWLLDSDFILLKPLPHSEKFLVNTICGLSIPGDQLPLEWVASPHCSFWTVEALKSFCSFCLETYRVEAEMLAETYRERARTGVRGSISDMTLLYLWSQSERRVENLFNFCQGGIIDHNIRVLSQPDGVKFKSEFRMKKLILREDEVLAEMIEGGSVSLYGIHFQGKSKALIEPLWLNQYAKFRTFARTRSWSSVYRRMLLKLRGSKK